MILKETLTNKRTTVIKSDLLLDTVTGWKHRVTSTPETPLILIEVVSHREAGPTPLEVTTPISEQPLGYLRRRKPNNWLLASALCAGRQGISAETTPPSEQ